MNRTSGRACFECFFAIPDLNVQWEDFTGATASSSENQFFVDSEYHEGIFVIEVLSDYVTEDGDNGFNLACRSIIIGGDIIVILTTLVSNRKLKKIVQLICN